LIERWLTFICVLQTFKGVGILVLALSAVVGVVSISGHLGESVALEQMTNLHQSTQSEADVADAILESAGQQGKMGSIPASIAALAAQVKSICVTGGVLDWWCNCF
jgi:hypothetical protein